MGNVPHRGGKARGWNRLSGNVVVSCACLISFDEKRNSNTDSHNGRRLERYERDHSGWRGRHAAVSADAGDEQAAAAGV
jgi:hypothetical protein